MKKNEATGIATLIMLALIAYPFIWLYETVGQGWFLFIVIGLPVLGLITYIVGAWQSKAEAMELAREEQRLLAQGWVFDDAFNLRLLAKIEHARTEADLNWARGQLQKIAYTLVGKDVPQEQKDRFTAVMKQFALIDPLYKQIMEKALPVIQSNPGVTQSTLYKELSSKEKELMRYVFYFAHELGHIYRKKKGNSYRLFATKEIADSLG